MFCYFYCPLFYTVVIGMSLYKLFKGLPMSGYLGNRSNVNYLYEPHMSILATFDDPSMVMSHDMASGAHSVWILRRAAVEVSITTANLKL